MDRFQMVKFTWAFCNRSDNTTKVECYVWVHGNNKIWGECYTHQNKIKLTNKQTVLKCRSGLQLPMYKRTGVTVTVIIIIISNKFKIQVKNPNINFQYRNWIIGLEPLFESFLNIHFITVWAAMMNRNCHVKFGARIKLTSQLNILKY